MAYAAVLPILTSESGLTRYLKETRRFPLLEQQEEYMHGEALARAWRPRRGP
jgi:RNA polymerase sigma-32 factor